MRFHLSDITAISYVEDAENYNPYQIPAYENNGRRRRVRRTNNDNHRIEIEDISYDPDTGMYRIIEKEGIQRREIVYMYDNDNFEPYPEQVEVEPFVLPPLISSNSIKQVWINGKELSFQYFVVDGELQYMRFDCLREDRVILCNVQMIREQFERTVSMEVLEELESMKKSHKVYEDRTNGKTPSVNRSGNDFCLPSYLTDRFALEGFVYINIALANYNPSSFLTFTLYSSLPFTLEYKISPQEFASGRTVESGYDWMINALDMMLSNRSVFHI